MLAAYVAIVLGRGAVELTRDPPAVPTLLAAFPAMHAAWGLGFVRGIVKKVGARPLSSHAPSCEESSSSTTGAHR